MGEQSKLTGLKRRRAVKEEGFEVVEGVVVVDMVVEVDMAKGTMIHMEEETITTMVIEGIMTVEGMGGMIMVAEAITIGTTVVNTVVGEAMVVEGIVVAEEVMVVGVTVVGMKAPMGGKTIEVVMVVTVVMVEVGMEGMVMEDPMAGKVATTTRRMHVYKKPRLVGISVVFSLPGFWICMNLVLGICSIMVSFLLDTDH